MAKKKHFSGLGINKIHTNRGPQCKKGSACAYKTAQPKLSHNPQAAHHIIPVATFIDYQVEDQFKAAVSKITAVYRDTDYCANRKKNIINLPRKTTYSQRLKKNGVWPAVWSLNLPCHNWDHHAYNEEVRVQLRNKIWKKFLPARPPVPHPDEEAVATSFDEIESAFHTQLTVTCPARPYGSTLQAIQAGEAKKPDWWHAFSMAMTVRDEPVFVFAKSSRVPVPQR